MTQSFIIPDIPRYTGARGLKTAFGTILPPQGRIAAIVCNGTILDMADKYVQDNLVSTLDAGLSRARAGFGDTVLVYPGHSESVVDATMLANLKAGTRIVGVGDGSNMPVFRWSTSTTAQWAVTVADVTISGLRLRLEGVNAVAKAIAWTGADGRFTGNDVEVASGASNICAICFEVGTGATRMQIDNNRFRGSVGNSVTDGIKIVGTAVDGVRVLNNIMLFSATSANGQVHVTSAATGLEIGSNIMYNTEASSQFNIVTAAVAVDGIAYDNYMGCLKGGGTAPASDGFSVGAGTLLVAAQNFAIGVPVGTGSAALAPAVDT